MRSSRRRGHVAETVSPRNFAWDRALVATLRHSTLPWGEALDAVPVAEARQLGARDRLSLLAQFAAHQALLQFAGVADGDLDPAEWSVVQKRGSDIRLVRTSAGAVDPSDAPPVLTIAQQFAEWIGATLDVLRQSWARADAIYAEAYARLTAGAAADLRWAKRAACGAIAAPGPEGLHRLTLEEGSFAYEDDECIASVERFAERVVVLRGVSPLERYSALRALISDVSLDTIAAADRIIASTTRSLFVVANIDAFDAASRQVVDLLIHARHGTWLVPRDGEPLPDTRWFVVSPRLAARAKLTGPLEAFVESDAFAAFLAHGDVPPPRATLPSLAEPVRSYIGALALIGTRIAREVAMRFLAEFHFGGTLEDLVVEGVTALDGDLFLVSEEAAELIPPASRDLIARVAAEHASAALEKMEWSSAEAVVEDLRRARLTPALRLRYAHALIDCGRYRDACDVALLLDDREFVLARAERRAGDYATALARLERMPPNVLRAEVLRLLHRYDEAAGVLAACEPSEDVSYERAVLAFDARGEIDETWRGAGYLASRFATYVALQRGEYAEAAKRAAESHALARCTTEKIDASLDRVYGAFCAGTWDEARLLAIAALQEVEETQGDRAAGGILFTLAYLAADNGQHAHASQRIARLRHYYAATHDALRLEELALLSAHLDFSRGKLADAQRAASAAYESCGGQIREAAALILDEIALMEGGRPVRPRAGETPSLLSTGKSGNAELTRRHELLRAGRRATNFAAAPEIAAPIDTELRFLRIAAIREFPFAPHDFDVPWCFATRNRLGQWHAIGSYTPDAYEPSTPDWIPCSDRELLFVDGSARWSGEGREALAAIFRTRAENQRLRRILEQEENARPAPAGAIDGIIGDCAAMREISALVTRIARRDVPVCILGESGTGKELVARAIHRHSPRRPKPFTPVNCAALPENLIESELFGHVRGAFTGADRDRAGLIETTDGGTLFLDEIGEMPLGAQAKLLRFLQEGEFRRVGDTNNRSADVRIVSATNRKLESAVEEGRFRDDLYYRIRGVEVLMPPLRERGSDILQLASHFLAAEQEKHRGGPSSLAPEVEAIFAAYAWPGNVRELQNTIRAAHAMAGEAKSIDLEHLPERLRHVAPARVAAGSYQDAVARFKRDLIERSLLEAKGNQNRAASMLRISRQALAYQIRELGIMVR
ncbi:MAG TPA: sigma 54-interacting transcriptional regulator [Thermoanaerobaculia bacterium]|nr:sigma 54-interacting transcriptional regulator [Thermoanaerobaculia bacterium]